MGFGEGSSSHGEALVLAVYREFSGKNQIDGAPTPCLVPKYAPRDTRGPLIANQSNTMMSIVPR